MNIPKSVQDCIPIKKIWWDGIWFTDGKYSKCWRFEDLNYSVASKEDKTSMFLDYSALLNSFDSNATTKVTICNRQINKKEFEQSILLPYAQDEYDGFRREYNDNLINKVLR